MIREDSVGKTFPPNEQIVQEVLNGDHGHGFYQRKKLVEMGYNPDEIQQHVIAYILSYSDQKKDLRSHTETPHRMKTGRYEILTDKGLYIFECPCAMSRCVEYSELSDVYKSKASKDGRLKKTRILVVDIVPEQKRVWGKTSQGWICLKENSTIYAKKI